MKIIPIDKLYTEEFFVKKIFAMRQKWQKGVEFSMLSHERPTNAFLYFSKGNAEFKSERESKNSVCQASEESLVYIPKGAKYCIEFSEDISVETLLFEFLLFSESGEEILLENCITELFESATFVREKICDLDTAQRAAVACPAQIMSLCCDIFYSLSKYAVRREIAEKDFGVIEKSIRLAENFSNAELTVAELAAASNVSVGTFNAMFKKYSGTSPGKYRDSLKLARAKKLLDSNTPQVCEISEALGFSDVGYFCRWFKKRTGITALEYRKNYKK